MSESTTDLVSMVEQTVTGMGYEFVDLEHLPRGMIRVTMDSLEGIGVDRLCACQQSIDPPFHS